MQSQRRFSLSCVEGFVDISRDRIALSRSFRTVEAPCMEVPPEMVALTFVFDRGAGDAFLEGF